MLTWHIKRQWLKDVKQNISEKFLNYFDHKICFTENVLQELEEEVSWFF